MRCFSVVFAIACDAAGGKFFVLRSNDLYALFGPNRKSVIAGPILPNKSNVAGRMRQCESLSSWMMFSPLECGLLGPLNFLFSAASWCRKTLSVISERDTSISAAERVFVPINVVSIAIFVILDLGWLLSVRRMSAGRLNGSACVSPNGSREMWFSLGMSCVMVAVDLIIVARQSLISLCAVLLLVHAMT